MHELQAHATVTAPIDHVVRRRFSIFVEVSLDSEMRGMQPLAGIRDLSIGVAGTDLSIRLAGNHAGFIWLFKVISTPHCTIQIFPCEFSHRIRS